MNKYDKIKQQQEKIRLEKQHLCPHERLDMVVIKRRCFDCGLDVPFRDPKDVDYRGHMCVEDTSY